MHQALRSKAKPKTSRSRIHSDSTRAGCGERQGHHRLQPFRGRAPWRAASWTTYRTGVSSCPSWSGRSLWAACPPPWIAVSNRRRARYRARIWARYESQVWFPDGRGDLPREPACDGAAPNSGAW